MILLVSSFKNTPLHFISGLAVIVVLLSGCAGSPPRATAPYSAGPQAYLIGAGDQLQVYVWRNPEVTVTVSVRPDGKISTPLVEDMAAAGKTPTQLARDIEAVLSAYIKNPTVTVIMVGFVGEYSQQIRVVGEAAHPQALAYRDNMTLMDVLIAVGGLTEYAAGNSANIVRTVNGKQHQFKVRLDDLLKGDIGANVAMLPGDILIVPESWF
jgi:polysaccharide export outer membrane protein